VARFSDEPRLALISGLDGKLWTAIYTVRGDRARIISARRAREMKNQSTITAQELKPRFDEGEDISPFIDISSIRRPGVEPRRVNVDFPEWMIEKLNWQSRLIGASRQEIVKLWVSERI
jgi:hypothetical protein